MKKNGNFIPKNTEKDLKDILSKKDITPKELSTLIFKNEEKIPQERIDDLVKEKISDFS